MTMINNIDISNVTIAILIAGYNKEVINKYERNITEKQNFIEHSQMQKVKLIVKLVILCI